MRYIFTNATIGMICFSIVPIVPLVPLTIGIALYPARPKGENNLSPLNKMHIHQ